MLFGVHVFARAKVVPDLALSRGEEAHRHARLLGDRSLEFAAAGGLALTHLELGDGRRGRAVARSCGRGRARRRRLRFGRVSSRLARGMSARRSRRCSGHAGASGASGRMATEQGRPAARCEALAMLALEAARLGAESVGRGAARRWPGRPRTEAKELVAVLPGHPPWGAEADAALARWPSRAASARGRRGRTAALAALRGRAPRGPVPPRSSLPAARVLFAGDRGGATRRSRDRAARWPRAASPSGSRTSEVRVQLVPRAPRPRAVQALGGSHASERTSDAADDVPDGR